MPFPAALTAVGEMPGMFSGEKGKPHTTVTGTFYVCRKSQCQCDMKKGGLQPFISNSNAAFTLFDVLRRKPTHLCRAVCCVRWCQTAERRVWQPQRDVDWHRL